MPSHKEHVIINKLLLGYSNPIIHTIMDSQVKYLGAGHRIAGHNLKFLEGIELLFGKSGKNEALIHLLVDAKIIDNNFIINTLKHENKKTLQKM